MSEIVRTGANPLFGPNKMKLGVFFGNIGGGPRPTTLGGRLQMQWGDILAMATLADRAGIEALVPLAYWTGMGGPSRFLDNSYDVTSWAAALAQATNSIGVLSTTQVATCSPLMAAKLAATIDHISGGRFGINIVCGRSRDDLNLFGAPDLDHDAWYDYASEWLEIVKRLWDEEERFDYEGKFFHLKGAISYPKPLQRPYPALMNAGTSEVGQRWASENADMSFTAVTAGDFPAAKEHVHNIRAIAGQVGRSIQVWMAASVVVRDTQQEAEDYVDQMAENGDWEAIATHTHEPDLLNRLAQLSPEDARLERRRLVGSSFRQQPLWGTPQSITEQLIWLSSAGVDGILLTFVNYHDELRRWIAQVMPLLEEAGLRQSH